MQSFPQASEPRQAVRGKSPTISVALCTYNGEKYLARQLDSLFWQEFSDFEIVAVDDNSIDATWKILEDYAARDARLSIYRNHQNLGHRKNFERALSLCRGEFLAPCDQDDVWLPEKLQRLLDAIEGASAAYCDSELVDADEVSLNLSISERIRMYSGSDPTVFVFSNCVSGHAMLLRRAVLAAALPFPEVYFHDWWLAFVATSKQGLRYVSEPLVRFRQHPASSTDFSRRKNSPNQVEDRLVLYEQRAAWLVAMAAIPGKQQAFLAAFSKAYLKLARGWFSIDLSLMIWRSRASLFYIDRNASRRPLRMIRKFATGLRLKQLFNRKRYPDRPLRLPHPP